jgi:cell volume regulation protein A
MNLAILVGAGLVAVSIFTSLVSFRVGAPLLLVFLLLGLGVGEDGLGLEFDNAAVAYFIGSVALAIILFDSGFSTQLRTFRVAAVPAIVLATVGVVLTSGITAVGARFLFGFEVLEALLIGAVVGSTDAAAVFFLLRVGGITVRERVRATLEIESGSNDPMAILLTLTLVTLLVEPGWTDEPALTLAGFFAQQFGLGILLGIGGGWLIAQIVNRVDLEPGLYPLVVLSLAVFLFAAVNMIGGSGFLAAYVAGLVSGNVRLRGAAGLRRFQAGMTWLSQIAMFLTLGLLATPSEFPAIAVAAVGLALILTLIARPVAVWVCLLPFGYNRRDLTFIAWVGLRGAVSILLAILPLVHGLPQGQVIFNTAFIIVLTSLLVQGWTVRPLAKWLRLVSPPRHGPLERVELELPGTPHHELVAYRILAESPVARGMRIPRWARPSLIVRDGKRLDVHTAGRLQPGDYAYVFTTPRQVGRLDRLFASPRELRTDDPEIYGDFGLSPDAVLSELGRAYGFEPKPEDRDMTVRDYLHREFGATVGPGDRLACGPVELIARSLDPEGRIEEVGLALEPADQARVGLQLLRRPRRILDLLRMKRRLRLPTSESKAAEPRPGAK